MVSSLGSMRRIRLVEEGGMGHGTGPRIWKSPPRLLILIALRRADSASKLRVIAAAHCHKENLMSAEDWKAVGTALGRWKSAGGRPPTLGLASALCRNRGQSVPTRTRDVSSRI